MQFTYGGQTYSYTVTRKRIKNIIMHVREDGVLWVSAPFWASDQEIQHTVEEYAPRLAERAEASRQRQDTAPDFSDGSQLSYLGKPITLRCQATPCPTTFEQDVLTVFARDPAEAKLAYRRWLADECKALYTKINREVYTRYCEAGYHVPLARIEIKDMSSRWGSCTAKTGRVSINFRLMQYPLGCIYGVFYHEYAHFMYLDHSSGFYRILLAMYPEYPRWDAILNHKGV